MDYKDQFKLQEQIAQIKLKMQARDDEKIQAKEMLHGIFANQFKQKTNIKSDEEIEEEARLVVDRHVTIKM